MSQWAVGDAAGLDANILPLALEASVKRKKPHREQNAVSANVDVGPREIVDGRTFGPGEVVDMDYRLFRNCIFDDCILVYNGGGFGWDGANDFRPRTIRFANDAARVLAFAGKFGLVREDTGIKL